MRYLAFDYGTQSSGIAVGGDISCSAEPLPALTMNNGWADDEQLYKLVAEWSPDAFVLGLPATPAQAAESKTSQPINIAKRVHSFSAYLQRKFNRPCHLIDERLSSRVMEEKLKDMGVKAEAGVLDSMVACALLQGWLEQQENTKDNTKKSGE
ncbi:MAG: Holliday junction resolvase RuvX [Candidatus Portiera sp.]|nr:Holliday junction resolvase RuvX [Portiera sp.]